MRAVTIPDFGGAEVLPVSDILAPIPAADEVLSDVAAAGINRADLLQRAGHYPPPPGAAPWPGLACSGAMSAVGADVQCWQVGQRVMALLTGGGYADQVAVPAGQVMPVPENLSFVAAATIPEALGTAWANLVIAGGLKAGDTVFIGGGSGGVGSLTIQLARALGARFITSAGGPERAGRGVELGADLALDSRAEDRVLRA